MSLLTYARAFRPSLMMVIPILILVGIASAQPPPFDASFLDRQMASGEAHTVELRQICKKPVVYEAWGVWNFPHSARRVADVALDFAHYDSVFHHVHTCERIVEPPGIVSPLGTWYLEGRYSFVRVFAIGDIDTLSWSDSSHLRVVAHQNEDSMLTSRWYSRKQGWLNYPCNNVQLVACIESRGKDSCRVGVLARGTVGKSFPQWLLKIATTIILTQLIGDIEHEVERREGRKTSR